MIRGCFAWVFAAVKVGSAHGPQGVAGFPAFTLMEFDCCSALEKGWG
jgi:hypothetical protein